MHSYAIHIYVIFTLSTPWRLPGTTQLKRIHQPQPPTILDDVLNNTFLALEPGRVERLHLKLAPLLETTKFHINQNEQPTSSNEQEHRCHQP